MQPNSTSQMAVNQFLTARLTSAQAALEAATDLGDNHLLTQAAENFVRVAAIVRRWQSHAQLVPPTGANHQGAYLVHFLSSHPLLELSRNHKLPLLDGHEKSQVALLEDFFASTPPSRLIQPQIRQRDDRLIIRFEGWTLPPLCQEAFSRRAPARWLTTRLSLDAIDAWLWRFSFNTALIEPYVNSSRPDTLYLTWHVVPQLSLPLDTP